MHARNCRRMILGAATLMMALHLAGCASLGGKPRGRMGSLPFPGLFTLYAQADPDNLGRHQYGMLPSIKLDEWETERGILYTRRAGFLDVAHIRMAADWCKYAHEQIKPALDHDADRVSFAGGALTRYTVTIDYPPQWKRMAAAERERIIHELSIQIAQRVSYDLCTWHEIITWFGYKSTVIVPENGSAFTYDDITSHVIGIEVAAAALRQQLLEYDDAVTEALDTRLAELEVAGNGDASEAIRAVEKLWWKGSTPLKRFFDLGYDDGVIMPWLAPGFESAAGPAPLHLPTLCIEGIDYESRITISLTTGVFEKSAILDALEHDDDPITVRTDFPALLRHIESAAVERFGPMCMTP